MGFFYPKYQLLYVAPEFQVPAALLPALSSACQATALFTDPVIDSVAVLGN